ncbi:MAG: hypothetical protein OWR62_16340 [Sulfobacillus thermotolerans]|nr:hypothetical protein [Sulfobacillus thermotolerans]
MQAKFQDVHLGLAYFLFYSSIMIVAEYRVDRFGFAGFTVLTRTALGTGFVVWGTTLCQELSG